MGSSAKTGAAAPASMASLRCHPCMERHSRYRISLSIPCNGNRPPRGSMRCMRDSSSSQQRRPCQKAPPGAGRMARCARLERGEEELAGRQLQEAHALAGHRRLQEHDQVLGHGEAGQHRRARRQRAHQHALAQLVQVVLRRARHPGSLLRARACQACPGGTPAHLGTRSHSSSVQSRCRPTRLYLKSMKLTVAPSLLQLLYTNRMFLQTSTALGAASHREPLILHSQTCRQLPHCMREHTASTHARHKTRAGATRVTFRASTADQGTRPNRHREVVWELLAVRVQELLHRSALALRVKLRRRPRLARVHGVQHTPLACAPPAGTSGECLASGRARREWPVCHSRGGRHSALTC